MSLVSMFLIYVIVFRLAIIATGATAIVLGYRLFCRGLLATGHEGSSFDVRAAGSRFVLTNAAPGTGLALFGAIIVVVMLLQGSPTLTWEMLKKASTTSAGVEAGSGTERITLRGIGGDTLREVTLQGRYLEEHGSKAEAIEAYEKAVSMIAEPLNDLAWLYQSDGKTEEAAALSQLAVSMRQDPRFLDTLAEIKFKNGDHTSAIKLLEKAVALNPSLELREKLTRFRNASQ